MVYPERELFSSIRILGGTSISGVLYCPPTELTRANLCRMFGNSVSALVGFSVAVMKLRPETL